MKVRYPTIDLDWYIRTRETCVTHECSRLDTQEGCNCIRPAVPNRSLTKHALHSFGMFLKKANAQKICTCWKENAMSKPWVKDVTGLHKRDTRVVCHFPRPAWKLQVATAWSNRVHCHRRRCITTFRIVPSYAIHVLTRYCMCVRAYVLRFVWVFFCLHIAVVFRGKKTQTNFS